MECGVPVDFNPEEGNSKYYYGDVKNLDCKPGYQGVLSIRCEANGQWSEIRGQCLKK